MKNDKLPKSIGGVMTPGFERYENYHADIKSRDFINLTNHLMGQVLTILEACLSDKTQLEAVKSLVRNMFWEETYESMQRCLFERQKGQKDYPLR